MSEVDVPDGSVLTAPDIIYQLDDQDRITFVSPDWAAFAGGNDGPVVTSELIGTKLWQHLCDPATHQIYQLVMAKVRETGRSITLPFRCDSPDRRRFMELEISLLSSNHLRFHSRLLLEEIRPVVAFLASASREVGGESQAILMCSWCKRVAVPEWLEAEEAVRRLRLFDEAATPLITHGMCPDCQRKVQQEIDAF